MGKYLNVSSIKIIPRLDIKSSNLIKGVQLEGLRVVGSPEEYAKNTISMEPMRLLRRRSCWPVW